MIGRDELHIHADGAALAGAAANRWVTIAREAISARGQCHVALAGGSTPRTLYRLLASAGWRNRIDWRVLRFWFGDERCVPPDHADSNYRMARESLFDAIAPPPDHIHRIEAERGPVEAADSYAELMKAQFAPPPDTMPRFDLVLLGLGTDGHVASLFPDTPLLDETCRWVGACRVDKLDAWRISLTFPVLNAARHLLMLVAGVNKAGIVAEVLGARRDHGQNRPRYPVERLCPQGRLEWLLDAAAAAGLEPRAGDNAQ
jgi:6-phosphogluconolactonase